MKNKIRVFLICLLSIYINISAAVQAKDTTQENVKIDILFNQQIPMRDGIKLSSTIWKPTIQERPLPVVFVLTPYISESDAKRAKKFVKAGYIYISVDRRGRGNSGGNFRPLEDSGSDGVDVIEWLAKQTWSNGQIVMRGGSYTGMVQWKVMAEGHRNLVTSIPTASVYPGHDFPKVKNIFMSYTTRWLAYTNGATRNSRLFGEQDYWSNKYRFMYENFLPFNQLDTITCEFNRSTQHTHLIYLRAFYTLEFFLVVR
jgi:predicted acyl esterase